MAAIGLLFTGGYLEPDGPNESAVSRDCKRRLQRASELWATRKITHILISGGLPREDGLSLAQTYSLYLMSLGVPEHFLRFEVLSRDTSENIFFSRTMLYCHGQEFPFGTVVLISNSRHLKRIVITIQDYSYQEWPWCYQPSPTESHGSFLGFLKEKVLKTYTCLDPRWRAPWCEWMRRRRECAYAKMPTTDSVRPNP